MNTKTQCIQRTICPHCERPFVLGLTGTIEGCDECLEIIRNTDGTVIDNFDTEDEMTDMEKA
jgi:hypothetical protein